MRRYGHSFTTFHEVDHKCCWSLCMVETVAFLLKVGLVGYTMSDLLFELSVRQLGSSSQKLRTCVSVFRHWILLIRTFLRFSRDKYI